MTSKRNNMMKELQEENKRLAQEKKDRDNNWRNNQQKQNAKEISIVETSDIMTENPSTTMSQLGPNRYVPYHFKGLTPQQQEQIMAEREQQLRDKRALNQQLNQEEHEWAMQQEANRQLMLQNELDLAEKQRYMMQMHKT